VRTPHPDIELIPFLRGELPPPDRERVAGHVGTCPECRASLAAFGRILTGLGSVIPAPPPLDPARFAAELRMKLRASADRTHRASAAVARWWPRLAPVAVAAGITATALFAVQQSSRRPAVPPALSAEDVAIGQRLDLLREYSLLERLDLLEDLEVIRDLDRLLPPRRG
jgi:anti-sigma factor RsiW